MPRRLRPAVVFFFGVITATAVSAAASLLLTRYEQPSSPPSMTGSLLVPRFGSHLVKWTATGQPTEINVQSDAKSGVFPGTFEHAQNMETGQLLELTATPLKGNGWMECSISVDTITAITYTDNGPCRVYLEIPPRYSYPETSPR